MVHRALGCGVGGGVASLCCKGVEINIGKEQPQRLFQPCYLKGWMDQPTPRESGVWAERIPSEPRFTVPPGGRPHPDLPQPATAQVRSSMRSSLSTLIYIMYNILYIYP